LRDEHARTIEPARTLAAEAQTLEREISNLVNEAYNLSPTKSPYFGKPPHHEGRFCLHRKDARRSIAGTGALTRGIRAPVPIDRTVLID
jgi:hypothetical protein